LSRDASGSILIEHPYTSASNRARHISESRSADKAKLEADQYSKHISYRLKGKAWTKRPLQMTDIKALSASFYWLKSGHWATGLYLKWLGHQDDDKFWWCVVIESLTREHHFHHCRRMNHPEKELWKAVGKATGWKAGRCRCVLISELFSIELCDQAVMDFLAATEVGRFPPKVK
jgi:hypothetical protein